MKPGTDLVGDAAGSDARWQAAVELLAPAGTASFVGLHSDQTSISWHTVIRANLRVHGSFGYADQDFQQAFDWLTEGKATLPLTPVRPLEEGPKAFRTLARGPIDYIKVILG